MDFKSVLDLGERTQSEEASGSDSRTPRETVRIGRA
jgi:hypothetical protein